MKRSVVLFSFLAVAACSPNITERDFYDKTKYHHTEGGFRNPPGSPQAEVGFFRMAGFIARLLTSSPPADVLPEDHIVPRAAAVAMAANGGNPSLTWIGHATFLIRAGGKTILTDPQFSDRASPFSFFGPKRFVRPGLELEDLPPIDAVVISHNHYDSFDLPSLKKIARANPKAHVLVPLGLGATVREQGFTNVHELDWYDTERLGKITIQATPAIHRANRGFWDTNQSLWAGFVIDGGGRRIWFAGDTGFGPVFEKEVAPRVGPVDIALIPIGAFLPRDIMKPVHVDPDEALRLARIMGAKTAIAMHWGTFPLAEDRPKLAKQRFFDAAERGVEKILMRIGETRNLLKPAA
ncbi:MAG: MBL fold metallo-hydrolase [Rhodospirillales bacterium]|nr:MBL fold metallo-hydrolase [Rhodospirillales bacterium]